MKFGAAILCAVFAAGAYGQNYIGWSFETDDSRLLATRPPYPYNTVDSTARPGFGGPVWYPSGHVGGHARWPIAWGDPGPRYYGAPQSYDPQFVYRRVHTAVASTPWIDVPINGFEDHEEARNLWLREHGYVGGVRGFKNPAAVVGGSMYQTAEAVKPRATIKVPDDVPRFRPQMEVNAGTGVTTIAALPGSGPVRVSLPPSARVELRARVEIANRSATADGTAVALQD